MCYVTIKELKSKLSYYLKKAENEDVYVTKDNEVICVLTSPEYEQQKALLEAVNFVEGLKMPEWPKDESGNDMSYEDIIGEEIMAKNGIID